MSLVSEWKKKDPLLLDVDGFERFLEERMGVAKVVYEDGKKIVRIFDLLKCALVTQEQGYYGRPSDREVELVLSQKGLSLEETNEPKTVLARLLIGSHSLLEHTANGTVGASVGLRKLNNYLSRGKAGEMLTLEKLESKLVVGLGARSFEIATGVEYERPEFPQLFPEYRAEATVCPRTLVEFLNDARLVHKIVELVSVEGEAFLRSYPSKEGRYISPSLGVVSGEDGTASYFDSQLLKKVLASGISDTVGLKWGTDPNPLELTYPIDESSELQFVVCPWTPEETGEDEE